MLGCGRLQVLGLVAGENSISFLLFYLFGNLIVLWWFSNSLFCFSGLP